MLRLLGLYCALLNCLPAGSLLAESILRDNDRIALIGNTFVERSQRYGHIETAMLAASPAKNLVVRNLGWSGDSVFNDSRSYFGPPSEGRERLGSAVNEFEPDVVFLCYGTGAAMSVNRSWTGEKGSDADLSGAGIQAELEVFLRGYRNLIENVRSNSGEQLREIILVTPPPLENLGSPLPDQVENNAHLAIFSKAIVKLASDLELRCIDLFQSIGHSAEVANPALTENGVHYGESGYRMIARHWLAGMGLKPASGDLDPLREEVIDKNRLFFHRWRPANETYLFLFRKHEQGNNAREIPMFDPLIEKKEKKIEALRNRLHEGSDQV